MISISRCQLVWATACVFFLGFNGRAASLTWDANGVVLPSPLDGSGTWLTASNWWDGATNHNGAWTVTAPDSAVFGAGTNGSYNVVMGSLYASNLTFNTSGYTLSGGSLTLSGGNDLFVASGVSATINGAVLQGSSATWSVGAGATLSLGGGGFSSGGNFVVSGGGTNNITGGTYTPPVWWLQNLTVNHTNGVVNVAADTFVGYAGNTVYNLNGSNASLNVGGKFVMGRGGNTGIFNLQNGSVAANAPNVSGQPTVGIGFDGSSVGVLNISGGTFTVAVGKVLYLDYGATSSGGSGTLNLSGGTLIAPTIQFGNSSSAYNANTFAVLNVSGGTLYVGPGGLAANPNAGGLPGNSRILLSGGVVAATANWTSSRPMTLTNLNGNITFQTADVSNNTENITLNGSLSGVGGLTKTGAGTLTLSATNTYSGVTAINAGILGMTTASAGGGAYSLATNAALNLQLVNAGTSLNMSALTLSGGSTVSLDAGSFGNPTAPIINVSGVLTPSNTVTLNLTGTVFASGQFPLIKYGSLAGAGFGAFQMGALTLPIGVFGSATLVNNTANHSIDASVTIFSVPRLAWNGNINGYWDIGSTANWQTNAYYSESNGVGPVVILDDSASGPNTAITLNNTVFPAAVLVSNSVANYSLEGLDGIAGSAGLLKQGMGTFTLDGHNTYTGGTLITAGTLAVGTTNNVAMAYTVTGGALQVNVASGTSLMMSNLTLGAGSPQLAFDFGNQPGSIAPAISDAGKLTMNGNVTVNVRNLNLSATGVAVLLRYAGVRSGPGNFVAGTVPAGVTIAEDTVNQQLLAYKSGIRMIIPSFNTNETIVALTTPFEYGAKGDGIADDSVAFQNAMNAVGNSGGVGGGVVYVPAGTYAFYNNISVPAGVTLQGDWTDWASGTNGATGTIFKVYAGAGQSNGVPFLTLNRSAVRGVTFWYPNQNPASITPYPYTISITSDPLVEDVALVNSYQGIYAYSAAKHIISTIRGSPLYLGLFEDGAYDISQIQDLRFGPEIWALSKLPGSPAANGPQATWMRANGTGFLLERIDGDACMATSISGYKVGVQAAVSTNGSPSVSFYSGSISNCATAFLDGISGGDTGLEFTWFTLDGDIAFDRNTTNDAAAFFHTCQLVGHNGMSVRQTGGSSSTMQFQNCNFTGTLKVDGGIANLVNCSLTVAAGSNQCSMASTSVVASFTGCIFNPTRKITNLADSRRLIIDGRRSSTSPLPIVNWSDIQQDLAVRRPAKTDLFVVTNAPWNATGDGVADDTAALQGALNAANANGGGIVYVPAGKYKLTGTLDVPGGVELRGSYPSRHAAPLYDGHVKVTVLQPYAGVGTTNGPPAVALEANAGIVGLTFSYELQDTNATPYPPAIQGRGANIYARGILAPNPYWYVDLNTYTCTNHFFYQVDGWALREAFLIGNGSRGSIIECMANLSYWVDNNISPSQLVSAWQPPIQNFAEHNLEWFGVGDCMELMVKNFDYMSHTFMHCTSQNGRGPWITGIETMTDDAVECFRFEAAAPCEIDIVNPEWMVTLQHYPDVTGYGVISTPSFQGTARFFNAPIWGPRPWDYVIQGGDVGFELVHAGYRSTSGTRVDGGVLHLINAGLEGNTSSLYTVPFTSATGLVGKASEIIGNYAWSNANFTRVNTNNPVLAWGNVAINILSSQTVFNVTAPVLSIAPSPGGYASLSWRNDMGAFALYSTPSLVPPVAWSPVTNTTSYFSNRFSVVLPEGGARQFYRLGP